MILAAERATKRDEKGKMASTSAAVVHDTDSMISGMSPKLQSGRWAFKTLKEGASIPETAIGSFREPEGWSVIVPADSENGEPVMSWITLEVYSSLEGLGLTAAVSGALTKVGIPCNVVAAIHHDHIFVPESAAALAMETLQKLSNGAAKE